MRFFTITRSRRATTGALALATGAVLALGLSACAPAGSADPELKSGDHEASIVDWRQSMDDCMLKAGFDLAQTSADGSPSESIDTSQWDMAAFDKAYASCTAEVGEAPVDDSVPSEDELFESQLIFAKCMRELGYDYPDPVKGSGGMGQAFGPETNGDDVDTCTEKANQAVESK
ncbi:hypothetical protein [Microbacterium sp. OVT16B]|uniref:hypothetical protein n=1 Tax=Microbacterium sp. OVT16B TaxID=2862682 RepID=UPI001CBA9820|nr:hypothetical protein [Microbacterium sp. OVT16B]